VNHLISNEEFAEQLDALLKASTESHDRLQDALVDCLLILQDSKRRGVDAALTHLLGVIQQQARPENAGATRRSRPGIPGDPRARSRP